MDLTATLRRWTPAQVRLDETGAAEVEWRYTGELDFTDPFFRETLDRAVRHPFSLLFPRRLPLEALAGLEPGLEPSGFVLHLSRCGSTVVAQMLASSPRTLVLSEPPPLDTVLRAHRRLPDLPADEHVRRLRLLVSALGRPRTGREERFVVKLDSWAILDLPRLRAAFPSTPWLFLYRDPLEVAVSHLRRLGAHAVPGALPPELFGIAREELASLSLEDYVARVVGSLLAAAADVDPAGGRFVDYADLPAFALEELPAHFGLDLDEGELAAMRAAATRDAKNPALPFEPDGAEKRAGATEAAREAVERWARPHYERMRRR